MNKAIFRPAAVILIWFWTSLAFANNDTFHNANLFYKPIHKKATANYSSGSYTQSSSLLGEFNLEVIYGELYGRAIVGKRIQWNWSDKAAFHGLTGGMMQLSELKELSKTSPTYKALYDEFKVLKPEYMKFKLPVRFIDDKLIDNFDHGHLDLIVEFTSEHISSAISKPYDKGSNNTFYYTSPNWADLADYTINKISTQDLRYIGKKRFSFVTRNNSKEGRAIDNEFNFTYAQSASIHTAAVEILEVRWPDKKIQHIFRRFIREKYKDFTKTQKASRKTLASDLNNDANAQGFWLGVNIDLNKYETQDSNQNRKLKNTLQKARERQERDRENLDRMLKRIKMSHSTFRSKAVDYFKDKSIFGKLTSNNINSISESHIHNLNGKVLGHITRPRRVIAYVNDVIDIKARLNGRNFEANLLYNYGVNEVKIVLRYPDGMELVDRYFIERVGKKIPLRATLIWDYDDYRDEKSDVDIAMSYDEDCRKDDLVTYHGNKVLSDSHIDAVLDIDNTRGFGPENISILNVYRDKFVYFCAQNYSSSIPAKAKVVIFKDEVIIQDGDNDYVWEYEFESSSKRRWRRVSGIYKAEE